MLCIRRCEQFQLAPRTHETRPLGLVIVEASLMYIIRQCLYHRRGISHLTRIRWHWAANYFRVSLYTTNANVPNGLLLVRPFSIALRRWAFSRTICRSCFLQRGTGFAALRQFFLRLIRSVRVWWCRESGKMEVNEAKRVLSSLSDPLSIVVVSLQTKMWNRKLSYAPSSSITSCNNRLVVDHYSDLLCNTPVWFSHLVRTRNYRSW